MEEITRILDRARQGEPVAAEELLPLVYDELRRLAAQRLAREMQGHTLQPTALVHEAWLRVAGHQPSQFQNQAHFFAAAAEAMRRILIDRARRRAVRAASGLGVMEEYHESVLEVHAPAEELLAVHEALDGLALVNEEAASLVKLRYFVGMTLPEAGESLGLPLRTAERLWTFSRAWLRDEIRRIG